MPLFSIVIPLYNKEKEIAGTMDSVLTQTFEDYEVIIVDDGSTDRSHDIVSAYRDPRIRIIQKENEGVSSARNRALEEAQGEFVAFLDADDRWAPEYLAVIEGIIRDTPEAKFIASAYYRQSATRITKKTVPGPARMIIIPDLLKYYAKRHSIIQTSSVCIKRDVFGETGNFSDEIPGQDIDMWIKVSLKYDIYYYTGVLNYYNAGANNRICDSRYPKDIFHHMRYLEKNYDSIPREKRGHIRKYLATQTINIVTRLVANGEGEKARRLLTFRTCRYLFFAYLKAWLLVRLPENIQRLIFGKKRVR